MSKETYLTILEALHKLNIDKHDYKFVTALFKKVSTSRNDEIAQALFETLSKHSTKENIPELQKYANDENPVVKNAVAEIIENINNSS